MALNFDGLGIGVSFDDSGASVRIKSLTENVGDLWNGLKKAGSMAGGAGGAIGKGLGKLGGLGRKAVGGITLGIGQMVDAAMDPKLDHAYSSMYAGFNKSFSAMTVGIDATSKEMQKARKVIGGVAFGLNEDMDGAAKTWVAFRKQSVDLTEVMGSKGLTGAMRDLIKVTSVFEVEGEQLAGVMGGLIHGFDFTEKGVGLLSDKMYVVGKAFDVGREAIQAWPSIFEALNAELADFGKQMNPQEIEKLTLSIVELGGGLHKALGIPAQAAMELARTAFTTLAGERKNIINMFRGMEGEFGDVARQLMETGGDANAVFEMLATGDPVKFMDTLREMAKVAEQQGGKSGVAFQRLSATMSAALGPDVAFAAKGNWDKVQATMATIPDTIAGDKAMGALKKAAAAHHKTGLTAGESWDRMVEGMKARLFGLSNKEIGNWQKRMKSGFEETFGVISKLASADGALGQLTTRLLAVQRVGLSALVPGLEGLAPVIGGALNSMYPMMTALGSMGLDFKSLAGMGMAGGGLWLVFELLKSGPDEVIERFTKMATEIKDGLMKTFPQLDGWMETVKERFRNLDVGALLETALTRVFGLLKKIPWGTILGFVLKAVGSVIEKVPAIVEVLRVQFFDLARGLVEGIGAFISGLDLSGIATSAIDVLKSVFGSAIGFVGDTVSTLISVLSQIDWVGLLSGILGGAFDIVKSVVTSAADLVTGIFDQLDVGAIFDTLKEVVSGFLSKVTDAVPKLLSGIVDTVASLDLGGLVGKIVSVALDSVKGLLAGASGLIGSLDFDAILGPIIGIASGLLGRIPGLAREALDVIINFLTGDGASMILGAAGSLMETVGKGIRDLFSNIAGVADVLPDLIDDAIDAAVEFLTGEGLSNLLASAATLVGDVAQAVGGLIWPAIKLVFKLVWSAIKAIGKIGWALITDVLWTAISAAFVVIGKLLSGLFLGIVESLNLDLIYYEMVAVVEKTVTAVALIWGAGIKVMSSVWSGFKKLVSAGWDLIKKSAEYVMSVLKEGWTKSLNYIGSKLDVMTHIFEKAFMGVRHILETVFTEIKLELFESANYLAEKLGDYAPDMLKEMAAAGKKFTAEFDKTGGMEGQKKRQKQEKKDLDDFYKRKAKYRKEENKASEAGTAKAKAAMEASADTFGNVAVSAGGDVLNAVKGAYNKLGEQISESNKDIDKRTDKEAADARKPEFKGKGKPPEEEGETSTSGGFKAVQKGKSSKAEAEEAQEAAFNAASKGKGKGKKKGKKEVAAAAAAEATGAGSVTVIDSGQFDQYLRKTDALVKAVEAVSKSPIDAHIKVKVGEKTLASTIQRIEKKGAKAQLGR